MSIPKDWQKWVALNVALGGAPNDLVRILVNAGFEVEDARQEVEMAISHPYVEATRILNMQLRKRDWLLGFLDKKFQTKNKYSLKPVPLPSFKKFLRDYYFENRPGIFRDAVYDWPAMQWTPGSLKQAIGSSEVEVQAGRMRDKKYEENRDQFRHLMPFDQFIDSVLSIGKSNDLYMTANNIVKSQDTMSKIFPDIGNIGDGYLDLNDMDKKCFVWIGPAGTLTPLHHDLTNNLFVQLYGRKRFIMIPAYEASLVYNERHVYSNVDAFEPDDKKFPLYKNATILDFDLQPGEVLFIPLGWWHAVESLDTSISLSFTNFNAPNNYNAKYPR